MNQPQFTHDCTSCVFLGLHVQDGAPCDLYYCGATVDRGTVIARYSDEGHDYQSGLEIGKMGYGALGEAYKRAVEKGLTA